MRNPIKKEQPQEEPEQKPEVQTQILEREITLSLLNDKLNYITGLLHKIVEAAEINM